jgi:hypothetical protein
MRCAIKDARFGYFSHWKSAMGREASANKTMTKINAEGMAAGRPCIYVVNYVTCYVDKKSEYGA